MDSVTTIVPVEPHEIKCGKCGLVLARAYGTREDAEQRAMEDGYGVPGQWECDGCAEKRRNPRQDYTLTEAWAEDHMAPDGVFIRIRKARKPRACGPQCMIRPGQEYVEQVIAPWVLVADDVDDEGRPIGSPNGEWTKIAFHRYGDEHNTDRKE